MAKRLYRSNTNRWLAGVCGGLGEFFGVNPTLLRVLCLVSAIVLRLPRFVFAGLILYVIMALIIPKYPGYTDI